MPFDLRDPEQLAARAPAYELAFRQAGHALDTQARAVADLTSRAGVLMAAAAVTTSIFGGQVLADGRRPSAAWVAIAAFVGVGLAVIHVLWPRREWEFDARAVNILTEYVEPADVSVALIQRDLTIHRATSFARNDEQLWRALRSLRVAMCLLGAEVVAWVVAFSGLA
jgi:hypothetical protein